MKSNKPAIKAEQSPELTDERILKGLVNFDPTEPDRPVVSEPVATPTPKFSPPPLSKTASQLLKEFLDANNIVITVTPFAQGIKTVSDGSLILSNPTILVTYKDGR